MTRPNQVWSTQTSRTSACRVGFVYLVTVIDWYSRKVPSWRLSNTLDSRFCVDCMEQSLQAYGIPGIFNTDQGSQLPMKLLLAPDEVYLTVSGGGARIVDKYSKTKKLCRE